MKTVSMLAGVLLASSAFAGTIAADAVQPHLAAGPDGEFVCVFVKGGNVQLSRSDDAGATWTAPVTAIDAGGNAKAGRQRGPRVAVGAGGLVIVTAPLCFDPVQLKEKYPRTEIWAAVSKDGGRTFGAPARVNEVAGKAAEGLHQLGIGPDGVGHVVWLDEREGKGQQVWYAKLTEGKAGKNLRISPPVCPCCAPGLAVDGKGNPVVAWREMSDDGSREIFLTLSKDGGKGFAAAVRVNRKDTMVPD